MILPRSARIAASFTILLLAAAALSAHAQTAPQAPDDDPEAMGALARAFPGSVDVYLVANGPVYGGVHFMRAIALPGAIFYQGQLPDGSTILINPTQIAAVKVPKKQ